MANHETFDYTKHSGSHDSYTNFRNGEMLVHAYDRSDPLSVAKHAIRNRYAWPGGYELAIVMTDGELMCCGCAARNWRLIADSTRHDPRDGWGVDHVTMFATTDPADHGDCKCCECGWMFTDEE